MITIRNTKDTRELTFEKDPDVKLVKRFLKNLDYAFTSREFALFAKGKVLEITLVNPTMGDLNNLVSLLSLYSAQLSNLGVANPKIYVLGKFDFDHQKQMSLYLPEQLVIKNGLDYSYIGFSKGIEDINVISKSPSPSFYSLYSLYTRSNYIESVNRALAQIKSKQLDKVVLSRQLVVEANKNLDKNEIFLRLLPDENSYNFYIDDFIGASPELLAKITDTTISCFPLAGTISDATSTSTKEIVKKHPKLKAEHEIVVRSIETILSRYTDKPEIELSKTLVKAKGLYHLGTQIKSKINNPNQFNLLEFLLTLAPTPAVCGEGREKAFEIIRALEPFDRELYGGAVGWIDSNLDCEFAVALRCAKIKNNKATLYAGAGIVADSNPEEELLETELKLRQMLDEILII